MSKNKYPPGALRSQGQLKRGTKYYIVWDFRHPDVDLENPELQGFRKRGPYVGTYFIRIKGCRYCSEYWLYNGEARIPGIHRSLLRENETTHFGYIFDNYWHAYAYKRKTES